jgi:hypothetical protein
MRPTSIFFVWGKKALRHGLYLVFVKMIFGVWSGDVVMGVVQGF